MKHILMVDDNTTNLKVAAQVLQPFYKLSMAKSGKQALSFLKKNRPDLILLDILMPEMDGYATLQEIKMDPQLSNIPVIFLTADKDRESEIKGLKMGALDFITKPFEEQVMLSRIEKVLQMEDMRKGFADNYDNDNISGLLKVETLAKESDLLILSNRACLIYCDFDRFSIISSDYDESFDNLFVRTFADILNDLFNNAYIGKIGADEFVVVFSITDDTDIEGYLRYITNECVKTLSNKIGVNNITCSAVAALSDKHGQSYEALFHAADKGMYYVKKTEGINYLIYDGRGI